MKTTTLSFSALLLAALSLVDAGNIDFKADEAYSLGLRTPFSEDRRSLPGWNIIGNTPQLLSDRMILTPPAPGNQRTGVWSDKQMPYEEWSLKLDFRASGAERSGGSLNLWLTQAGAGKSDGPQTVYSSKPFDGLAVVIESRDAGVGTLRAYLNDGRMDYSQHHNPPTLAFGHCNFNYRNKGVLSTVKITHAKGSFKIETDGQTCFETSKVRLPRGYYLGLVGATVDPPDSFEIFNLITSSPETGIQNNAADPQKIVYGEHKLPPAEPAKIKPRDNEPYDPHYAGHYEQGKAPHDKDLPGWKTEDTEEDHHASFYKTEKEQFADLHNRLQALTHHLAGLQQQLGVIYDHIDYLHNKEESLREEFRGTRVPREQIDSMDHRMDAMQQLIAQIATTVTNKDYSQHFENLQKTLKEHHSNLLYAVPDSVTQVLKGGTSHFGTLLTALIVIQVAVIGGYVYYKRRRNSNPKKYL